MGHAANTAQSSFFFRLAVPPPPFSCNDEAQATVPNHVRGTVRLAGGKRNLEERPFHSDGVEHQDSLLVVVVALEVVGLPVREPARTDPIAGIPGAAHAVGGQRRPIPGARGEDGGLHAVVEELHGDHAEGGVSVGLVGEQGVVENPSEAAGRAEEDGRPREWVVDGEVLPLEAAAGQQEEAAVAAAERPRIAAADAVAFLVCIEMVLREVVEEEVPGVGGGGEAYSTPTCYDLSNQGSH
ncbi:hypothetical protein EJB05_01896, partial [Eragrostis curvula]